MLGMKRMGVLTVLVMLAVSGCDGLRFAPSEAEKQNVYLHKRTVECAARQAERENSSADLQQLTQAAANQSEAIVAHYGLPAVLPKTDSIEALVGAENEQVTAAARADAVERPDPWEVADGMLELGIAVAGVVGGVYGSRAAAGLKLAQEKSRALREVIAGNELFKRQNPEAAGSFKEAQGGQSPSTRTLVAELKNT